MQELPARGPGPPDRHLRRPRDLGFVELADQGREDVGAFQVEIVSWPVEVGGLGADGVKAVLPPVGLAQLDPGDLGNGIPFVGVFQRPGQQVLLPDRLGRHPGVDAARPGKKELFRPGVPGGMDDVRLDHEVFINELRRARSVGLDTPYLGRHQVDVFGPLFFKERLHRLLIPQVQLLPRPQQQLPLSLQPAYHGRSHQPPVSRNEYLRHAPS